MHLLLDNAEVQSRRVVCPPPEALESVCQLFGIPYRYDKAGSVFAVQPPLLGSRILITPLEVRRQPGCGLYDQWDAEMRLLARLLWVCGADVTLRSSRGQDGSSTKGPGSDCPPFWDLALFAVPGLAVPGCIQPLAVYPWWHRGLKSRKLAGELAFWDDGYSDGFKRITTFRVASELKKWFSHAIAEVPAPCVLLSVPMIDGYTDRFLDRLSISVSQAVLRFFSRPLLPPCVWDAMKREDRTPEEVLAGAKDSAPIPTAPPTPSPVKPSVSPQPAVPETALTPVPIVQPAMSAPKEQLPVPPAPSPPVSKAALVSEGVGQVVIADHKPRLVAKETAPQVRSPDQRRGPAVQQASRPTPQPSGPPMMPPTASQTSPGAATGMRSPLPAAQRDSDQVRNLRESLIKSPELALKQAEEVLSRRGIKPTPERVDEYLKYLRRMLQLPEDQGDETP
jgi:hypothetical protein